MDQIGSAQVVSDANPAAWAGLNREEQMSKSEYEEVLLPICKEALKHRTHWQQQAREAVESSSSIRR